MTEANNSKRQCVTCGKLYKVCFTCEAYKAQGHEFWRATACSPECYQVHLVLSDFYYKKMNKDEARGHLDRLLDDNMQPYTDNSRGIIEDILKDDDSLESAELTVALEEASVITDNEEFTDIKVSTNFLHDDVIFYPEITPEDIDEETLEDEF